MVLVVQAVRRLTLTAYSLPSASAEEVGFCPHPKPHLVWYLFALCQRTVEVKERCQSVPFGYQRPADGLSITASGFVVNTAGDKKSQAVLMFMIYKIIYFFAHFSYLKNVHNPL